MGFLYITLEDQGAFKVQIFYQKSFLRQIYKAILFHFEIWLLCLYSDIFIHTLTYRGLKIKYGKNYRNTNFMILRTLQENIYCILINLSIYFITVIVNSVSTQFIWELSGVYLKYCWTLSWLWLRVRNRINPIPKGW